MKIGIVVPFSWSFWGAVVEHAELQAAALEELGHEVRLIMGNDPPGQFTRVLHPRVGRHGSPPAEVIPVGRSVIVPANGSLPNIVLSPRSFFRIRRVLENLVTNAAAAVGPGGRVKVRSAATPQGLRLEVEDTGPGIPEEVRETLFEPFVTFGKKEGTGLGLAIVKTLTERNGGTIRFESSSSGTRFLLDFPRRDAA